MKMVKLKQITAKACKEHLTELRSLFSELADRDVFRSDSGFSTDKDAILRVFNTTSSCNKSDILVRLTLIDSMYSTQMNRRYYALEELAEVLAKLANGKKEALKNMFILFTENPELGNCAFNYKEETSEGKIIEKNLFSENYGIGKDGENKGVAISLVSKYAYFETEFKFPIYDSIACEMFPYVWQCCGFGLSDMPKLLYRKDGKIIGNKTMIEYVNAINKIIGNINCPTLNYDIFDRFLWFVGKICRGNLSLVLTRKEYEEALQVYPPKEILKPSKGGKKKVTKEYFDIRDMDIKKLKFLNNPHNRVLCKFFEYAKFYRGQIELQDRPRL